MSRWSFPRLSRPARIGALVGFVAVLPVGPLLEDAAYAIANVSADWTGSVAGHTVGVVVRPVVFILCLLLVFGAPTLCGGLLGSFIGRMKARRLGV